MRRREFITILGSAGIMALPSAVLAQLQKPVIGFLHPTSPKTAAPMLAGLQQGLSEAGFIVDRDVVLETRFALGDYQRLPALAAELVARKVTVIVANGGTAALAAKAGTTAIPIVSNLGGNPVELGLIASLSRPGGNMTGITQLSSQLEGKRLGLLREIVPTATVIAHLMHADNLSAERNLQNTASLIGTQILELKVSSEGDIEAAFDTLVQKAAGALLVGSGSFLNAQGNKTIALAARHRVPASYARREDVEAGGLMSYGTAQKDTYRLIGVYVGRILKGEKPADLPVAQPTKFELVLNLKTAKALGINISPQLLALADEVIE